MPFVPTSLRMPCNPPGAQTRRARRVCPSRPQIVAGLPGLSQLQRAYDKVHGGVNAVVPLKGAPESLIAQAAHACPFLARLLARHVVEEEEGEGDAEVDEEPGGGFALRRRLGRASFGSISFTKPAGSSAFHSVSDVGVPPISLQPRLTHSRAWCGSRSPRLSSRRSRRRSLRRPRRHQLSPPLAWCAAPRTVARRLSCSRRLTVACRAAQNGCPMRQVPGFERALKAVLQVDTRFLTECPPAIVAARAALARTPPIRHLRPQPLPARFLAVAALASLMNAPLGAWRAHTRKFSGEWVVAVHASVPFIAMLRKALLMPPYAVLVTVAAAIAGQAVGSRAELARMRRRPGAALVKDVAAPRGLGLADAPRSHARHR